MQTSEYLAPISVIRLFETTKAERQSFAVQVIERLEQGTADPLETHLHVKMMEDTIKQITSNDKYKDLILEGAQKQGGKSFDFHNAKFEIKEVGSKFDFSKCNDPELIDLYARQAEIDAKVKAKETFLKTVPQSGIDLLVEDEVVKVYPPAKSSTTSVAVTLK